MEAIKVCAGLSDIMYVVGLEIENQPFYFMQLDSQVKRF